MPTVDADGATLAYDTVGDGPPLVLVNGGFQDRMQWLFVTSGLAESCRVVAFDARGHGDSTGRITDPFDGRDDILTIIDTLRLGPAHVVAHSGGGLLALHAAIARPDLFASLSLHEPALLGLLDGDAAAEASQLFQTTWRLIRGGDGEAALRGFMAALGGDWNQIPPPFQQRMLRHVDNYSGDWFGDLTHSIWHLDPAELTSLGCPMQLTRGSLSPPLLQAVNDRAAGALPGATVSVIDGAGHMAMVEQPARFTDAIVAFTVGRTASC